MIKSTDLRIGNWVSGTKDYEKYPMPLQVVALMNNEVYYRYATDEPKEFNVDRFGEFNHQNSETYGIPLSPSILEKCGFVLAPQRQSIFIKGRLQLWMGHTGCIAYLKHEDNDTSFWIGDCKHLHQLQNLYYSLVGQELTINF